MAIGLGLGISRFPFETGRQYFDWVELCEKGGVDSIWQTDRLVSSEPMLETMSTMAALAGATDKMRFGMNVASIALRDPLQTAKQCATIDRLSDGRLLPAFGIGSALSLDYKATGTPTKRRGKKADEALQLVQRLWMEDSVDFDGEFFKYEGACISPKPANARIPLWIGGSSEVAMKRTAKYGTGWLGGIDSPEQTAVMIKGIRQALKETGRSIDDDHYGATFSFRIGDPDSEVAKRSHDGLRARLGKDPDRYLAIGDAETVCTRINEFLEAGCSKFVMLPIVADHRDMMNQTRRFVEEVQPEYLGNL